MKKYNTILSIFIFYILLNMIIFPDIYINEVLDGISAWAFHVLPSILPFLIFSKILLSLNAFDSVSKIFEKPTKFLFNTPAISSYVFLSSIFSGYPVGAKITADLFEQKRINRTQAAKMLSFCSTSGPLFIVGGIGISMLHNKIYGYIILLSHILGAIFNGIIYRNLKINENLPKNKFNTENKNISNNTIILDSVLSILNVGAIIAIFFVVTTSLNPILQILPEKFSSILKGFIEITNGSLSITKAFSPIQSLPIITLIISFSGVSSIIQSFIMIKNLDIPFKIIVLEKVSHAIISFFICTIFCFTL